MARKPRQPKPGDWKYQVENLTAYERKDRGFAIYTRVLEGGRQNKQRLCDTIREGGKIVPALEAKAIKLAAERQAKLAAGIEDRREDGPADLPRTKKPRSSLFRAPYSATLKLLARELRNIGAKDVVLECDADWSHIRKDGQLRADARLRSQGVILAFESRHGPLRYPCDAFDTWQDNLRAIALSLEALRTVDRFGVARRGEQYRGWDRLPPAGATSVAMTTAQAAAFVSQEADHLWTATEIIVSAHVMKLAYRHAAAKLHPDAGGSTTQFQMLQEARRVLDRHHQPQGVAR